MRVLLVDDNADRAAAVRQALEANGCVVAAVLPANLAAAPLIAEVNQEDIWRDAAKLAGVTAADLPAGKSRGVETFFDGKTFDPAAPAAYLAGLAIKKPAA